MILTNKGIENARERIAELYVKLGSTTPNDEWTMDDIRGLMFCLELLDYECKREQKRRANKERFTAK